MLAYSSIAHAGYVLVALAARSESGTAAAMFYLAAYAFMNIGAFAVVAHLSGKGERYQNIEDFAGLGQKQPLTAAMFTIFLLSLIGVPLTGGFFGKFYIFKAALESHLVWLTVLGLLNSAVAAYYYLRILVVMYMHEPGEAAIEAEPLSPGLSAAADSAGARHPDPGHLPDLGAGFRRTLVEPVEVETRGFQPPGNARRDLPPPEAPADVSGLPAARGGRHSVPTPRSRPRYRSHHSGARPAEPRFSLGRAGPGMGQTKMAGSAFPEVNSDRVKWVVP